MTRSSRARLALLTVLAVVASTLALLPALGDPGPEVVRLDLSPTGEYFTFDGTTQAITSDRCAIDAAALNGALVTIGPDATIDNNKNNRPGVNAFGIGYKSGSSQGTPCGRVSVGEPEMSFAVSQSGPLARRVWDKVRFDLEVKGSAVVEATLTGGGVAPRVFTLFTGRSDAPDTSVEGDGFAAISTSVSPDALCRSGADSGPDSGANDNCLWTIDPSGSFDKVTLKAIAGEFSVEGGYDFRSSGGFTDPLGYGFNTVFFLVANRAPVAVNDGLDGDTPLAAYTTDEDTSVTVVAPGVLANDSDPDGDLLTAVLVSGPSKGDLTLNANGSFTYDPDGEFEDLGNGDTATETFTYRASDGALESNTATVTITITGVNDAPTATDDGLDGDTPLAAYSTNRDQVLTVAVAGILGNDTDPEGDTLTVAEVNGVVTDVGVEVALLSGALLTANADGSLSYDPNGAFDALGRGESDTDSFTYKASDGALLSNEATVTITINGLNFVPVASDDEYSTADDDVPPAPYTRGLVVAVADGVLANDDDGDGDTLTAALVDGPSNGNLNLDPDGSFTYDPAVGFYGADTFTYSANDGFGGSDTATVTIYVPLECGEPIVFEGVGQPTYTVIMRPEDGCPPKDAVFDAGLIVPEGAPDDGQYVRLQPRPTSANGTVYAFLEKIEWLPVSVPSGVPALGPPNGPVLEYNDQVFDLDGTLNEALMCLSDPRKVVGGEFVFDLDPTVVTHEVENYPYLLPGEPSWVLPLGQTTCIITATFDFSIGPDGPIMEAVYWLFNIGDGLRTFK